MWPTRGTDYSMNANDLADEAVVPSDLAKELLFKWHRGALRPRSSCHGPALLTVASQVAMRADVAPALNCCWTLRIC